MKTIWYLLKCPEGNEADFVKDCLKSIKSDGLDGLQEVIHFQYQRMIRYGGQWHLERKSLLPGYVFLSGIEKMSLKWQAEETSRKEKVPLKPCETPYLRNLCPEGNLVEMSKGFIKNGMPVVTSGPLQGKEILIRKIDRHKRTAVIEIPFEGREQRVTVGLEIYEKQR